MKPQKCIKFTLNIAEVPRLALCTYSQLNRISRNAQNWKWKWKDGVKSVFHHYVTHDVTLNWSSTA